MLIIVGKPSKDESGSELLWTAFVMPRLRHIYRSICFRRIKEGDPLEERIEKVWCCWIKLYKEEYRFV